MDDIKTQKLSQLKFGVSDRDDATGELRAAFAQLHDAKEFCDENGSNFQVVDLEDGQPLTAERIEQIAAETQHA